MTVRALLCAWLILGTSCARNDVGYADGTGARYDDWKGRWVLVNYWAEWCAPCRQEIPELNALYRDRAGEVLVVGVNFDGVKGVALTDLMARMAIEFPVVLTDPRERWQYDRPSVLPTTVVIDPSGNVVGVRVGPQTRESLEEALTP